MVSSVCAGSPPADAVARAAGRGGPPAAAPPSLEYFRNSVTGPFVPQVLGYEVAKCRCNVWFCPDCCIVKGYNLRAALIPILETFSGLLMVSLTVDPTLFESPKSAFLYMLDRRCVSRTIQDLRRAGCLHSKRYFYVVEWQSRTEQAHFHVLLDASFVPFSTLLDSWSKHRPAWAGPVDGERPAFGTVFISKPTFEGGAPHAARYATKYLVKAPAGGFPAWVTAMGTDRLIRRYGTSRGFWGRPPELRVPSEADAEREIERHTYAERMAQCGTSVVISAVTEQLDNATGEVTPQRSWVGELAVAASVLDRLPDGGNPKRRRRLLSVSSLAEALEVVGQAAGETPRWARRPAMAWGE